LGVITIVSKMYTIRYLFGEKQVTLQTLLTAFCAKTIVLSVS